MLQETLGFPEPGAGTAQPGPASSSQGKHLGFWKSRILLPSNGPAGTRAAPRPASVYKAAESLAAAAFHPPPGLRSSIVIRSTEMCRAQKMLFVNELLLQSQKQELKAHRAGPHNKGPLFLPNTFLGHTCQVPKISPILTILIGNIRHPISLSAFLLKLGCYFISTGKLLHKSTKAFKVSKKRAGDSLT